MRFSRDVCPTAPLLIAYRAHCPQLAGFKHAGKAINTERKAGHLCFFLLPIDRSAYNMLKFLQKNPAGESHGDKQGGRSIQRRLGYERQNPRFLPQQAKLSSGDINR